MIHEEGYVRLQILEWHGFPAQHCTGNSVFTVTQTHTVAYMLNQGLPARYKNVNHTRKGIL